MRQVRQSFRVMTYEIDYAGVLSNQVYIRWLEDLRNLFADQAVPLGELMARGIVPVLTRTEIDYLLPVRLADVIDARMWLAETGRSRFVLAAEFSQQAGGQVVVKAKQTGVFVSTQTGRPLPLPEEFKDR